MPLLISSAPMRAEHLAVIRAGQGKQRAPLWGGYQHNNVFSLGLCLAGTILAIYGSEKDNGKFLVEDHCFADLPRQLPMRGPSTNQ